MDKPIELVEDLPKPPPMKPPESYRSSGTDWMLLEGLVEGLSALVDIFDIFIDSV